MLELATPSKSLIELDQLLSKVSIVRSREKGCGEYLDIGTIKEERISLEERMFEEYTLLEILGDNVAWKQPFWDGNGEKRKRKRRGRNEREKS